MKADQYQRDGQADDSTRDLRVSICVDESSLGYAASWVDCDFTVQPLFTIHDSQIKFPYMICEMNRYKVLKKGPS